MCIHELHLKFGCGERWKFWDGHLSPELVEVEVRILYMVKMHGSYKNVLHDLKSLIKF